MSLARFLTSNTSQVRDTQTIYRDVLRAEAFKKPLNCYGKQMIQV